MDVDYIGWWVYALKWICGFWVQMHDFGQCDCYDFWQCDCWWCNGVIFILMLWIYYWYWEVVWKHSMNLIWIWKFIKWKFGEQDELFVDLLCKIHLEKSDLLSKITIGGQRVLLLMIFWAKICFCVIG